MKSRRPPTVGPAAAPAFAAAFFFLLFFRPNSSYLGRLSMFEEEKHRSTEHTIASDYRRTENRRARRRGNALNGELLYPLLRICTEQGTPRRRSSILFCRLRFGGRRSRPPCLRSAPRQSHDFSTIAPKVLKQRGEKKKADSLTSFKATACSSAEVSAPSSSAQNEVSGQGK